METIQTQQNSAFFTTSVAHNDYPITKPAADTTKCSLEHTAYTAILLKEYRTLVDALSSLDTNSFSIFNIETNVLLDNLLKWFDEPTSAHSLTIYWEIQHLKQKIRKHKN